MLNKQFVQVILAIVTVVWVINFFAPLFPNGSTLRNAMVDTIFMGTVGAVLGAELAKATLGNRNGNKRPPEKDANQDQDQDGST